jgi:Ankyrin repeats (3 copies)
MTRTKCMRQTKSGDPTGNPAPLPSLPEDVLRIVTRHLPLPATVSLRQTCRALQHAPLGALGVSEDHIVRAVEASNLRAVRELLQIAPTPRALAWAAFRGNVPAIDVLLTRCDPTFDSCTALVQAAEAGRLDAVRRLLPLCDPRADESRALRKAALRGHIDVVVELAPVSDHRAYDSSALRGAAHQGHAPVVKFLLAAGEADPCALGGVALKHAARDGRIEIVRLLLPYHCTPALVLPALQAALQNGRTEIVKLTAPYCWPATTEQCPVHA